MQNIQHSIESENDSEIERQIGSKVKAIFEAQWIHVYIGKHTTQFIINWNDSGMKMLDQYMIRDIEEITGKKFDNIAIHSTKCITVIFYKYNKED